MENWKDTCRGSKKNVLTELLKKYFRREGHSLWFYDIVDLNFVFVLLISI
jgi:hypothetical protein